MIQKLSIIPCLVALALATEPAHSQFVDDFEDGELHSNPAWHGDLENWRIAETPSGRRLESQGPALSDTLLLATTGMRPFGTWRFTYGYSGGALSNFNQVRVFLWSDPLDAEAGYYLLIGSNDRTVKLYDAVRGGRALVAAAADDLLDADSADAEIRIERDYTGTWRVWLNDVPVIEQAWTPPDPSTPGTFRLWIKHTTTRGSDHWFDDISLNRSVESDGDGPLIASLAVVASNELQIRFDEPVTAESACRPGTFNLDSIHDISLQAVCPDWPFPDTVSVRAQVPFPAGLHRLTTREIEDPSGNVTSASSMDFEIEDFGKPPGAGDLIINEIDYAPEIASAEFVEIVNISAERVDLTDVWFADDRTRTPISPGARRALSSGDYIVLTRDLPSLQTRFAGVEAVEVPGWPSLNNGGDAASVGIGESVLDSVSFSSPTSSGTSLERLDPRSPSDLRDNWSHSTDPEGATPGRENSVFYPDVTPPQLVFVEQTSPVALRAVFSEAIPTAAITRSTFSVSGQAPAVVAPGAPRYSPDFFLAFEPLGSGPLIAEQVADPARNSTPLTSAPIHMLPTAGQLVINEIMFEPRIDEFDGLPDQAEYIELWNLAPYPITLNSCSLVGPPDETGHAESWPIRPTLAGTAALEYAIVVDSQPSATPVMMFDRIAAHNIRPLEGGSLALRNEGSRRTLRCGSEEIESVRWDPDWHHPELIESRGISLERISASASAEDPRSWTSSLDAAGGTPGRINTVALASETPERSLSVAPSPFSPNGDGFEDHASIYYHLRTDRALIRITIFDSKGRTVRNLSRGSLSARSGSMIWDGRNDGGQVVPTGIYIVFLEASDGLTGLVEVHKAAAVVAVGFN